MIKHIVFWRVKDGFENQTKSEIIEHIVKIITELKAHIPEIVNIEVGKDFNGSPQAFDVALYSEFRSKEDLNTYQNHPEHQKVAQYIKSVAVERAVVDYTI